MNKKNLSLTALGALLMLWPFTRAGAQSTGLEYWFDQYENPTTIGMPTAGGTLTSHINVSHLTQGIHTIYMRVKDNGVYSPITSSVFLKFAASGESVLEYWFDDDFTRCATININASNDMPQTLNLDLNNDVAFPYGLHRLNMRLAIGGSNYSPVYSDLVMRLPNGQKNELIYWLDDDYKNGRRVIKAKESDDTTSVFNTTLNLSSVSPGMHRFKYRIASNGIDDGVVYEVPVLITQRYNSQAEVFVVGESHWVDDISPMEYGMSNPKSIITMSYTLDPSQYTVGQHAFHVQYKNSAEVWSEQNITYFYKEASGKLRIGIQPDDRDGIDAASVDEHFICFCDRGVIYVDCQSSKLASTGVVQVYDMTGKLLASQAVSNSDGIHSEINMEGVARQMLIVKLLSGEVLFNKKIMLKDL